MMFLRFLTVAFLLLSCNSQIPPENSPEIKPEPVEVEVPAPTPEVSEGEVPHVASTPIGPDYPVANVKKVFTVKIENTNYTPEQKAKLDQAEKVIAKIMNSEEYKQAVLSRKFTSTEDSSEQVYKNLFEGAEALQPAVNYQMDLKVTMYFRRNSTVGYTYASSLVVYTNSKFHNYFTVCEVASNLVHEWTHKMGYGHSSAGDSRSVPYAHNAIVKALCPKFI